MRIGISEGKRLSLFLSLSLSRLFLGISAVGESPVTLPPAQHFTALEPENTSIYVSELNKIRGSTDFDSLKSRNVRSGSQRTLSGRMYQRVWEIRTV